MGSARIEVGERRTEVLKRWVDALAREHVTMGPEEAVASALAKWLELLGPACDGDEGAAHELYKLVAFHARGLGAEGRPASAALMQVMLFEEALQASVPGASESAELGRIVREIMRIVVDAHALGATERARNRHHLEIRDFSPVVRFGERAIIGFLLGPMESDLIDAMVGRILREVARTGASEVVLDCFGAARDNDTFHHTLHAFMRHEVGCRVTLTLSGLRDPDTSRAALLALGCNPERLRFETDVNSAFAGLLTPPTV